MMGGQVTEERTKKVKIEEKLDIFLGKYMFNYLLDTWVEHSKPLLISSFVLGL